MNSLLCEQKNATRAKGERSLELKNTLQKKDRLETVILSSAVVKTNKALNLPRTLDFLLYYLLTWVRHSILDLQSFDKSISGDTSPTSVFYP